MSPLLDDLRRATPTVWLNPNLTSWRSAQADLEYGRIDIDDAEALLLRHAPWIAEHFEGTDHGIIESPFIQRGSMWVKLDSHLPISGSIKARGGIYTVLKLADDLGGPLGDQAFYSRYRITVASTGNLGLSIGIMSAAIGFRVEVHMSREAKQWKKDMLREKGCVVVEHEGDFNDAVAIARQTGKEPDTFFVDDENSADLFMGYAVAGRRLKAQLERSGVEVTPESPLHVYLPCGVGGGPGGVLFGLKTEFEDNVHGYFVEPTHAPSMVLGLATGRYDDIAVADIGLDGITVADGLAVGRTSGFVGKRMGRSVTACVTTDDATMLRDAERFFHSSGYYLEPSAAAGFTAYEQFAHLPGTHVVWATGGSMVPEQERLSSAE
ncbi:D-serine ammonia-lyase [Corynebacterium breve]|uniref:Probable D-serine dehydratase n=1 Tax=Corynebacterium breve TaxID=3049799 RepID=A0ABY8VAX7_9CORY|nr:D-serine ammonia-lyase [Corynebacterium breve]WIM66821.1 D-serine ammonia-lyase [Corynebacterium breve]